MKSLVIYILLAAAAVGLGLAGGYYACQQNYNAANEGFYNGEYDQEIVDSMSPSLVIEGGYEFDFGKIDSGKHVHEFIVENRGNANLKFSLVEKSENVEIDFGTEEVLILPGASLPIGLTLNVTGPDQKTGFVELETNDKSKKTRLVVSGS